jgi:hydrogenase-4 component E
MSEPLVVVMVCLGLAVLTLRRRSVAIAAVSLQSILLGYAALNHANEMTTALLVVGLALIVKGLLLPLIFAHTVRGARERRPVAEQTPAPVRLLLALAFCLALVWAVGDLGLRPRYAGSGAIILLAFGLGIAILRQPTIFQALGFVVAENGAYLAALCLATELPPLIEAGLIFDLLLTIGAAALFTTTIRARFGTSDSAKLNQLRER